MTIPFQTIDWSTIEKTEHIVKIGTSSSYRSIVAKGVTLLIIDVDFLN